MSPSCVRGMGTCLALTLIGYAKQAMRVGEEKNGLAETMQTSGSRPANGILTSNVTLPNLFNLTILTSWCPKATICCIQVSHFLNACFFGTSFALAILVYC